MKKEYYDQIKLIKESIDWWQQESYKTSIEVDKIDQAFENGQIKEDEVISRLRVLSNKINYLAQKGVYEQKSLFEFFREKY